MCCSRIVTFSFCLLSLVRTDPCWGKARKLGLKEKPCPQSAEYEGFLGTLLFVCSCPVPLGSAASNWVPSVLRGTQKTSFPWQACRRHGPSSLFTESRERSQGLLLAVPTVTAWSHWSDPLCIQVPLGTLTGTGCTQRVRLGWSSALDW